MNGKIKKWFLSGFFLGILSLCSDPALAGPLDGDIEGAKKEGEVRLGITVRTKSFGQPSGQKYLDAFREEYPFLKVNFKRIGGSRERERVISEMAAGVVNYDVATASQTMVQTILDAKLARIVDWGGIGSAEGNVPPQKRGRFAKDAGFRDRLQP